MEVASLKHSDFFCAISVKITLVRGERCRRVLLPGVCDQESCKHWAAEFPFLQTESILLLEELGLSVQDLKLPLTFSVKFFQEADFVALHVQ